MRLGFEARAEPSRLMSFASPIIAVALTLVVGLIVFTIHGEDPLVAFYTFFISPIDNLYGLSELLIKASPLVLIAIGLAVGFRANVWNIGAEGQLTIGAIVSGGIAIHFYESQSHLLLPVMIVGGALGGMLWAGIPALLRTRFNANEILVSLMLAYVAQMLLSYLIYGPWRDPEGFNFPQSRPFTEPAMFSIMIEGTRLNTSVLITLVAVAVGWIFMKRSYVGYQMLVAGLADRAARYAGFSNSRTIWIGMLAGGAAAGLAGVGEVAGPLGQMFPTASPGYGFAAIIVAFLGRLNPIGIVLAGLLMSLLYLSGEAAQMSLNLPSSTTAVFQGLLLSFLLSTDVLIKYRIRMFFGSRNRPEEVVS